MFFKALAGMLILLVALAIAGKVERAGAYTTPPVESCEEDQACWDCTTMGNKICGPAYIQGD